MPLSVREVGSAQVRELYITATPAKGQTVVEQARQVFAAVSQVLSGQQAWICQERVFAPAADLPQVQAIRKELYSGHDDPVPPTWLASTPDHIAGVQVHAICGTPRPQVLSANGRAVGRVFDADGLRWVSASSLRGPLGAPAAEQARSIFEQAAVILRKAGGSMRSVARTWIFMDDILRWYRDFNLIRTGFFLANGVIAGSDQENGLPASTGVGVSPACGNKCAMDLVAVVGPENLIHRYHAAGKQRSAFEYGSAFARASRAQSLAGQTVFVSGTAAIDSAGRTCFGGDIHSQIRMTMDNVNAVLGDMGCSSHDVVQAIAYCVTRDVERIFLESWASEAPWPWISVIGDACRDDLLFEVEVVACKRS